MNWYTFEPADTLFFRGAQPMNIGENHTATANFPPPARTIEGSLRTAMLKQNEIPLDRYYNSAINKDLLTIIGPPDKLPGFSVIGPLFKLHDSIYVPAPYSWFYDKENKKNEKANVYKNHLIKSQLVKTPLKNIFWAKGEKLELESLGGKWLSLPELYSQSGIISMISLSDFYNIESRTGIALENNRGARLHHLYSFNHARLNKNVQIIFGVDRDLPISDTGVLKLGAEQRFGYYSKILDIEFNQGDSGLFMSLSQLEGTKKANDCVVATGKIEYLGGWDMKIGFHKPMIGFFPSGSVFNQKLNDNFLEL
jgi:CRISPR-associated protein Cmr3